VAGYAEHREGEEALPARHRSKQDILRTGEVYTNTPFLPFDGDWRESKPFERWEHPAESEPGVIGGQLRLDEVGDRYGFPQRVRTPSATAVIAVGSGSGGGVIVKQEPRGANMPAEFYEPAEWGGGILVHPLDDTWRTRKVTGADADLNAEVVSKRQEIRLRHYKYIEKG
jgi:hypothetical protein